MNYDPSILIERIIYDLEEDMTFFNTWYEFDDAAVHVSGIVSQDFEIDNGDWFTPPSVELYARSADLYIKIADKNGERTMSLEEIYYIEKQLEL